MAVTLLAVFIRLWVAFWSGATWNNTDTAAYFNMADAILRGDPYSYFPNGYPLILAGIKLLAPPATVPGIVIGLNVVLSTLTVLLVTDIGRRYLAPGAALFAGGLLAVWPNQLNYVRQLLSEVPATFLLVAGLWLVLKKRGFSAGLMLALGCLVRSTLTPVVGLVGLWMVVIRRPPRQIVGFALAVFLIVVANQGLVSTGVIARPSNEGANLLFAIQRTSSEGIVFNTTAFTPAENARPVKTYLAFAVRDPEAFLRQRWAALWELWGPWPRAGEIETPRSNAVRLLIGIRFPLLMLALLVLIRQPAPNHWLLAIPIFAITAVHVMYYATPRYSYVAEPSAVLLCSQLGGPATRRFLQRVASGNWSSSTIVPTRTFARYFDSCEIIADRVVSGSRREHVTCSRAPSRTSQVN